MIFAAILGPGIITGSVDNDAGGITTYSVAGAHFGYSGPLTETCLLGNIAKRVDARIEWDAANLKITNLPDANKYVRVEYRKGWTL